MNKLAVFRADASKSIGGGHIHRCLILASELVKAGFEIFFICKEITPFFASKIIEESFKLIKDDSGQEEEELIISTLKNLEEGFKHSILIIDNDNEELIDYTFQIKVKSLRWKLMYFVFHDKQELHADIILNQNIRAQELEYITPNHTVRLLGTQFVILKKGFDRIQNQLPEFGKKRDILFIFFGSADYRNRTLTILNYILKSKTDFEKVIVVAGSINDKLDALKSIAKAHPGFIDLHVQTDAIHELMAEAKFAFTSGGLSLWELACCKVNQIVIPTSERERLTLDYCIDNKLVHTMKDPEELSFTTFKEQLNQILSHKNNEAMVNKFYNLVSTKGVEKVAEEINQLF